MWNTQKNIWKNIIRAKKSENLYIDFIRDWRYNTGIERRRSNEKVWKVYGIYIDCCCGRRCGSVFEDEDVFDEDSEDEACSNCDCQKEETVEPSDTVEENGQEDSPAEEDSQEEEEEK